MARKGKKKSKKQKAARHSSGNETVVDHAVLFVKSAGGMERARQMLSKLALLHR